MREYFDPRQELLRAHRQDYLLRFGEILVLGMADIKLPHDARIVRTLRHQNEEDARRAMFGDLITNAKSVEQDKDSQRSESSLLEQLKHPAARIMIVGDGGIGKSETLHSLVRSLAEALNNYDFSDDRICVPVFIDLAQLDLQPANRNELPYAPLIDALCQASPKFLEAGQQGRSYFDEIAKSGQLCVLLDGLDEATPKARELLERMLPAAFTSGLLKDCALVIASRPSAIPFALLNLFSRHSRYELGLLDRPVIEQYIRDTFSVLPNGNDLAHRLCVAIRVAGPGILQLLRRPLFLALCCLLAEDPDFALPRSEADLMERSIRLLLKKRGFANPRAVMAALGGIVCGHGRISMPHDQLVEIIAHQQRVHPDIGLGFPPAQFTPSEILAVLGSKSGFFTGDPMTGYRFTNKPIAEYINGAVLARTAHSSLTPEQYEAGMDDSPFYEPAIDFFMEHAWNEEYRSVFYWMATILWSGDGHQKNTIRGFIRWLLNHLTCPRNKAHEEFVLKNPRMQDWPDVLMRPLHDASPISLDDLANTLLHRCHDLIAAAGDGRLLPDDPLVVDFLSASCGKVYSSDQKPLSAPRLVRIVPAMPNEYWVAFDSALADIGKKDERGWVQEYVLARRGMNSVAIEAAFTMNFENFQGEPPVSFHVECNEDGKPSKESVKQLPRPASSILESFRRWHPIDEYQRYPEIRLASDPLLWNTEKADPKYVNAFRGKLHFRAWYDELWARFSPVFVRDKDFHLMPLKDIQREKIEKYFHRREIGLEKNCPALALLSAGELRLYDFLMPPNLRPILSRSTTAPAPTEARSQSKAGVTPRRAETSSGKELSNESKAIAFLTQHPDWSMRQIADAVDVSVSTLSTRYPLFRKAWDATHPKDKRAADRPRGHKDSDGNIEAYSDDE